MIPVLFSLLVFFAGPQVAPSNTCEKEALAFQEEWNTFFADSEKSILSKKEIENFKGLDYFPFDAKWCVLATFFPLDEKQPYVMKTTTGVDRTYLIAGELQFQIEGRDCRLTVFEPLPIKGKPHKSYWFIPFKDHTNGEISYGGGRYLELQAENLVDNTIEINFHKSYAPYCAYSEGYSCPIVPDENMLEVAILAGTKIW
jgi:uncharacterized protein